MASDLTQLRDIHLPPPIGWWPAAPGWYLLAASIALVSFALVFLLKRHYINGYAKREALQALRVYRQRYQHDKNSQAYGAEISKLLRRVALAYYPRTRVAGLQGEAWIVFLNNSARGVNFFPIAALLLELPYKPRQAQNIHPLFDTAHKWIKRQGKPCSN